MKFPISLMPILMVAACADDAADNVADQLDNAAGQSDNAAAPILKDAADDIRSGSADPVGDAQNALSAAGNAQVETEPPPAVQAKPREAGDPVPPPTARNTPD